MRKVVMKLLNDGTKRVRIHWFVRDDNGPALTPSAVVPTAIGPIKFGGVRGYIACRKTSADVTPQVKGDTVNPQPMSDDLRAVTCPDCIASEGYEAALAELNEALEVPIADVMRQTSRKEQPGGDYPRQP